MGRGCCVNKLIERKENYVSTGKTWQFFPSINPWFIIEISSDLSLEKSANILNNYYLNIFSFLHARIKLREKLQLRFVIKYPMYTIQYVKILSVTVIDLAKILLCK